MNCSTSASAPASRTLTLPKALAQATAHQRAGNLPAAAQLYQGILTASPGHAESWHQLGLIRLQQGHLDQADACLRQALPLEPGNAAYWMHHGIVLKRRGQLDQALAAYDQALTLKPDYPEAHNNRGNVLSDLDRPREALAAYDQAAQRQPNFPEAHRGRAHSLSQLGRSQDALAAIDQVLALRPEDAASHAQRILLLKRLGRLEEALAASDAALARFPQEAALYTTRGGVLKAQGRIDAACADYQRALTLQRENIEALINLIQERRLPPGYPALAPLQAALQQPKLDVVRRKDLHFALATLHEQHHETDAAFHHYQAGHVARAEHLRHRYHTDQARARLTCVYKSCTTDFFTARRAWGHPSTRPIFILGMPRSGTTLTEQILASHPAVAAGGELPDMARLAQRWTRRPETLTATEVQHLAERYLERLARIDPDAPHVTDKMPHNFEHLWLIALLFPQATVLHCERDPLATCWSIYSHNFATGHAYADDLVTLGEHYRDYQTLMAHWQQVLPLTIHPVPYEALVRDPEPQIRALLDVCQLPFDPACLRPHHTQRPVQTASAAQVNQPIHSRAIDAWRRYEAQLGPLVGVLGRG